MTIPTLCVLQRYRLLRRLWLGATVSALGDALTWMALIWFVLEKTRDGTAVGAMLLCFALPTALTGGPIGRLLDRWQPRTLMVADNVLRAALTAAIPLLERVGYLSLPALYLLAALCGALAPATRVGVGVLVPRIVAEGERASTNAALALSDQVGTVLGPALAGVVIAAWGAPNALLVDAASFLAMAWALRAVPDLPRGPAARAASAPLPWKELTRPAVALLVALSALSGFVYGPTETAMPLFIQQALRSDARGFGGIWSSLGIGAVCGGLLTGWLARFPRPGVFLALSVVLWGVFEWLCAGSRTLTAACACFFLAGVVWGPYLPLKTTLLQRLVPEAHLGAVLGLQSAILTPMVPLGTAMGGVLLRFWEPATVIAASGLACIVGGLAALAMPTLRDTSA